MLVAHVDSPGNPIDATALSRMSTAARDAYRGRLLCPDGACQKPAYYVSPSRAGTPGHFASRQHTDTCQLRTTNDAEITDGQLRKDRALVSTADVIALRIDRPLVFSHVRSNASAPSRGPVGVTRVLGSDGIPTATQASMGLRRLLAHMARGGGLGTPGPTLMLPDQTTGTTDDLVLHADKVGPAVLSGEKVYWGKIVSASETHSALWLNSGNVASGQVSLQLAPTSKTPLLQREGLASISDLWGLHFLCVASARSKATHGAVLPVPDIALLALAT